MANFIDAVETGFNRLTGFLIGLVAASIGLFAVLIPINLLLIKARWGFITGLYEAIEYTLYVGIFLGAPWVLQQGAHVRIDLFVSAMRAGLASLLDRLLNCIGAGICAILFVYGVRATLGEFADGTLPDKDLRIANWYMMAVFAFSFFLLTLEFLFRLRRAGSSAGGDAASPTKAAF